MRNLLKHVSGNLLKKKPLSESASLETKLSRCLNVTQLFFYAVSVMAGAGIYILAGHIVKNRAGPATNLSFLIGGLSAIFTGFCYCELATLMPQAGSCYTYTYVLVGELPAFLIAWTVIMDSIITLSSVSKGFSGVLNLATNDVIGNFTRTYLPLASNSTVIDTSADIVAASLIILLFIITITGVNISFTVNSVLQTMQILCLLVTSAAFYVYGSPSNYVADGGYMPFGFPGIIQGAAIAVFSYSGFECIANSAEEIKNPKRSIPIALFSSLLFVIILYLFVTSGLSYMVPRLQINEKSPFVAAFENKNLDAFKWIATVGALIATGATKLSVTFIIGRIIYAVAKDALVFQFLGLVNKTTRVPIMALFAGCLVALILALFIKIESLADVTSLGILISFIAVGVDLIILRYVFKKDTFDEPMKTRISLHPILTSQKSFIIVLLALFSSIIVLEIALTFSLTFNIILGITLTSLMSVCVIGFFTILCLYEPDKEKDLFQTPLMPIAPIMTIAINFGLLLNLPVQTWIRFIVWTIIGLVIYFAYAIWKYKRNTVEDEYYQLSEINHKSYLNEDSKLSNADNKS